MLLSGLLFSDRAAIDPTGGDLLLGKRVERANSVCEYQGVRVESLVNPMAACRVACGDELLDGTIFGTVEGATSSSARRTFGGCFGCRGYSGAMVGLMVVAVVVYR